MPARDRTQARAGDNASNRNDFDDVDNDAPWLAPAGEAPRTRVSRRSLFWTALLLLSLAAVAAVGLVLLLSKKDSGSTQGYMNAEQAPLISAEPGPYKIAPADPKGLAVEGQDQTIYQAGEGIDTGSTIDMSALPEQPMPRPGAQPGLPPGLPRNLVPDAMNGTPTLPPAGIVSPAVGNPGAPLRPAAPSTAPRAVTPAPAAAKPASALPAMPSAGAAAKPAPAVAAVPAPIKPALAKPAPAQPAPTRPAAAPAVPAAAPLAAKKSGTAQLGAFSSEAKANAAWAALSGRNPGLAGFGKRLVPVESNGQTLWRLRASGGDAAALCASLKAGGFACTVIE